MKSKWHNHQQQQPRRQQQQQRRQQRQGLWLQQHQRQQQQPQQRQQQPPQQQRQQQQQATADLTSERKNRRRPVQNFKSRGNFFPKSGRKIGKQRENLDEKVFNKMEKNFVKFLFLMKLLPQKFRKLIFWDPSLQQFVNKLEI